MKTLRASETDQKENVGSDDAEHERGRDEKTHKWLDLSCLSVLLEVSRSKRTTKHQGQPTMLEKGRNRCRVIKTLMLT